jgi:hypothetical protein
MQQMNSLFKQIPAFAEICGRFCFQDELNLACDIFDVRNLQCHRHPAARPQGVNCDRKFRFFSIHNRLLEQQSFSAIWRFHLAIRPFRNEQFGIDRDCDALQLARLFKSIEELSK